MTSAEVNTSKRGTEDSFTRWDVLSEVFDGIPRLKHARNYFSNLEQKDVPVLQEAFRGWRDYDEFLILHGENRVTGEKLNLALKCSKRGNDVFSRRLDKKMGFMRVFEGIDVFSMEDFEKKSYMPSNLLWITLTFDPKTCSLDEAWDKIGDMWNLYITNLRNKYGKIKVLKFFEAFPTSTSSAFGYPHIHACLLFENHKFNAFPRWEKMKNGKEGIVYRIKEKNELKNQGKWSAFSDIKAISSGRALGGYLTKHCKNTQGGDEPSALTTQALLWLKKKKTFTMSGGFREAFNDLITSLRNSKGREAQATLDGGVLDDWVWSCHGVKSAFDVGAGSGEWVVSLSDEKFNNLIDFGS